VVLEQEIQLEIQELLIQEEVEVEHKERQE
jgi:hypothetical protein